VLELLLDSRAVTAMIYSAPGDNGSTFQDRSKSRTCGVDLLNFLELI
jgi:hypothetical protein